MGGETAEKVGCLLVVQQVQIQSPNIFKHFFFQGKVAHTGCTALCRHIHRNINCWLIVKRLVRPRQVRFGNGDTDASRFDWALE